MADVGLPHRGRTPAPDRIPTARFARLPALPSFQAWAARMPILRRIVRSEGEAMFDLVAGFCHSQVLQAMVRLRILPLLLTHRMTAAALAQETQVPLDRMTVLLNAGVSLRLLKQRRGYYALTARGTALAGVPGLQGMIDHHAVLYRDLVDPVAFFRGETETELAAFWPYVFGADGATDPAVVERYSRLMTESQALVAADTIAAVSWTSSVNVMDVGGGTGAFLTALGHDQQDLNLTLFDLPAVAPLAARRFADAGLTPRATIVPGSFRDDALPTGADTITLVRVLYDHSDQTVLTLLRSVHDALPPGGRVIVSEPMTGGDVPYRPGDAYFALYCMAMQTGRARSRPQIKALMQDAGFTTFKTPHARRPFVTSIICGVKEI